MNQGHLITFRAGCDSRPTHFYGSTYADQAMQGISLTNPASSTAMVVGQQLIA
jgi:hypothetical protein